MKRDHPLTFPHVSLSSSFSQSDAENLVPAVTTEHLGPILKERGLRVFFTIFFFPLLNEKRRESNPLTPTFAPYHPLSERASSRTSPSHNRSTQYARTSFTFSILVAMLTFVGKANGRARVVDYLSIELSRVSFKCVLLPSLA
jgi:hypothetical protein